METKLRCSFDIPSDGTNPEAPIVVAPEEKVRAKREEEAPKPKVRKTLTMVSTVVFRPS
jgi:hypothetical protein